MSERVLNGDRAAELWEAVKDRSLPVKALTRAEYEALSGEEKAKDILYITPGEGAESPPAENVYSMEETRIGTWIDGKPLYRKVYKLTTPSNSDVAWIGEVDSDTDYIARIEGVIKAPSLSNFAYVSANQYLNGTNSCCLWVDAYRIGMCVAYSGHRNCPVSIIVEYTKATD